MESYWVISAQRNEIAIDQRGIRKVMCISAGFAFRAPNAVEGDIMLRINPAVPEKETWQDEKTQTPQGTLECYNA